MCTTKIHKTSGTYVSQFVHCRRDSHFFACVRVERPVVCLPSTRTEAHNPKLSEVMQRSQTTWKAMSDSDQDTWSYAPSKRHRICVPLTASDVVTTTLEQQELFKTKGPIWLIYSWCISSSEAFGLSFLSLITFKAFDESECQDKASHSISRH